MSGEEHEARDEMREVHTLKEIADTMGAQGCIGKPDERGAIKRIYQNIATFF